MQILRYMVYIWEDYEHQQEALHKGISHTKAFRYPPVLPIVYYEGKEEWDATMTLNGRVLLDNAFHEFIPNFNYLLISLNKYGKAELIDQIKERKHMALFDDWEGFDVQKERKIGEKNGAEKQNIKLICRILAQGWDTSKISDLLGIDVDYVEKVSEIVSNNQLNDDVDAIFNELYKEKV